MAEVDAVLAEERERVPVRLAVAAAVYEPVDVELIVDIDELVDVAVRLLETEADALAEGDASAALITRQFTWSAKRSLPCGSSVSPYGMLSCTPVASPPTLPSAPGCPVPAIVVMTPVALLTIRTRWFHTSENSTSPQAVTATPRGELMLALVALPPSPL